MVRVMLCFVYRLQNVLSSLGGQQVFVGLFGVMSMMVCVCLVSIVVVFFGCGSMFLWYGKQIGLMFWRCSYMLWLKQQGRVSMILLFGLQSVDISRQNVWLQLVVMVIWLCLKLVLQSVVILLVSVLCKGVMLSWLVQCEMVVLSVVFLIVFWSFGGGGQFGIVCEMLRSELLWWLGCVLSQLQVLLIGDLGIWWMWFGMCCVKIVFSGFGCQIIVVVVVFVLIFFRVIQLMSY